MIVDTELFSNIRQAMKRDWIRIPVGYGYGGTGGPGRILEELAGVSAGNQDVPDSGKWELKFHSQNALLTLFHKEGEPKGHLHQMVRRFGWPDKKGRLSFRHTIHGRSDKGFYVVNESNRITVRHPDEADIVWPYWAHDTLINAFAAKFRRLIVVKGQRQSHDGSKWVRFESAKAFEEPRVTLFVQAIEQGIIAIDFDARTQNGRGLRNHGTKFRIHYDNLQYLYESAEVIAE